jgi:pimeloyl-ACP methyl ester carboxylesterase
VTAAEPDLQAPCLLILPGLDGAGGTTGPFVELLGNRVQAVRVTYPRSESPSRAELARAVLGDWPAERPVVVLGESYSTAIAVAVAAARPPRLAGLILVAPSFASPPRRLFRLFAHIVPPVHPPAAVLRWLLLGRHSAIADPLTRAVARVPARVLRARLREYLADPTADDPVAVDVPVLALRATRDRLLSAATPEDRPGVEWVTLDAPHLVLGAVPAIAADVVAAFVSKVTGAV